MRDDGLKIDVQEVLDYLGVHDLEWRGPELHYQCPFPGHKEGSSNSNASFRQSERHPWWMGHCHVCGWSGDIADFYATHQGLGKLGRNRAKRELRERYAAGGWSDERFVKLAEEIDKMLGVKDRGPLKRPLVPLPEEALDERAVDWRAAWREWERQAPNEEYAPFFYMFQRGFTPETLERWEIGYDEISGMISIPYRDAEGRLIALKGRAWWPNAKPKYRFLGNKEGREDRYDFETADISQVLYGLWRLPPDATQVILCEGELNRIAMDQFGFESVLGLSGQFVTDAQARILSWVADEVLIIFDELEKAVAAADTLERTTKVWIVPERDKDPADADGAEEITEWIRGALTPFEIEFGI